MPSVIAAFIVIAAALAPQPPPGLGDDPAKFDQLLDAAFAGRDTAFLDAVTADDMRFTNGAVPGGAVWNKRQFLDAARASTGLTRTVDAVQVEQHGDLAETVGRVRVVTVSPVRTESHIDFVRLYRHGPRGWQFVSHRTVREVEGARPTPSVESATGAQPTEPGVFRPGNGVTMPRLLHDVKPQYTSEAMQKRIQGMVLIECVVNTDGSVRDVKVVRSLDALYGLDEQAIEAAKQWRFAPGTRNGQPVPVMVSLEMTFTLGK
jgi:TonB family protein